MKFCDLGSLAYSLVWRTFGLLPCRGVSMNLTREQVCLSILTKIGFLFERRHMLVDQDNYGRRHCLDALKCTPHLLCTLLILQDMRMWVQQHHFSVSLYVFRPYSSTPPTKSLGTFGKQNIYWSKRKKNILIKWLLMIFWHTQRSIPSSTIIREASSFSK